MHNQFCPVHDRVREPNEPDNTVFFGLRGPEIINADQNAVCTCGKDLHAPSITDDSKQEKKDESDFK